MRWLVYFVKATYGYVVIKAAHPNNFASMKSAFNSKMSIYSRRKVRSICQSLQFTTSDGEDDAIEDVNNSTGAESGFTELDSPMRVRRHTVDKRLDGGSPLGRGAGEDDGELWDEEGFGSPSLHSPSSVIFANCSPSPRKSSRLYSASPEPSFAQEDGEAAISPIPDCPDTPPHKTFRKLRLFDTPHTPKVCII